MVRSEFQISSRPKDERTIVYLTLSNPSYEYGIRHGTSWLCIGWKRDQGFFHIHPVAARHNIVYRINPRKANERATVCFNINTLIIIINGMRLSKYNSDRKTLCSTNAQNVSKFKVRGTPLIQQKVQQCKIDSKLKARQRFFSGKREGKQGYKSNSIIHDTRRSPVSHLNKLQFKRSSKLDHLSLVPLRTLGLATRRRRIIQTLWRILHLCFRLTVRAEYVFHTGLQRKINRIIDLLVSFLPRRPPWLPPLWKYEYTVVMGMTNRVYGWNDSMVRGQDSRFEWDLPPRSIPEKSSWTIPQRHDCPFLVLHCQDCGGPGAFFSSSLSEVWCVLFCVLSAWWRSVVEYLILLNNVVDIVSRIGSKLRSVVVVYFASRKKSEVRFEQIRKTDLFSYGTAPHVQHIICAPEEPHSFPRGHIFFLQPPTTIREGTTPSHTNTFTIEISVEIDFWRWTSCQDCSNHTLAHGIDR